MTTGQILVLAIMGLIFAIWTFFMFRALFRLNTIAKARREERGVGYFGGVGITFEIFYEFAVRPEHRAERNRLLLVTVLMFAFLLAQYWSIKPA